MNSIESRCNDIYDILIKVALLNLEHNKPFLHHYCFGMLFPFTMECERKKISKIINEIGGRIVFDLKRLDVIVIVSDDLENQLNS